MRLFVFRYLTRYFIIFADSLSIIRRDVICRTTFLFHTYGETKKTARLYAVRSSESVRFAVGKLARLHLTACIFAARKHSARKGESLLCALWSTGNYCAGVSSPSVLSAAAAASAAAFSAAAFSAALSAIMDWIILDIH